MPAVAIPLSFGQPNAQVRQFNGQPCNLNSGVVIKSQRCRWLWFDLAAVLNLNSNLRAASMISGGEGSGSNPLSNSRLAYAENS